MQPEKEFTDTERLDYIIKYQGTQLFYETMESVSDDHQQFREALDKLMREYPEID